MTQIFYGVLAGTNWTGDLVGVENDAYELREEIEVAMSEELIQAHQERYAALTRK